MFTLFGGLSKLRDLFWGRVKPVQSTEVEDPMVPVALVDLKKIASPMTFKESPNLSDGVRIFSKWLHEGYSASKEEKSIHHDVGALAGNLEILASEMDMAIQNASFVASLSVKNLQMILKQSDCLMIAYRGLNEEAADQQEDSFDFSSLNSLGDNVSNFSEVAKEEERLAFEFANEIEFMKMPIPEGETYQSMAQKFYDANEALYSVFQKHDIQPPPTMSSTQNNDENNYKM